MTTHGYPQHVHKKRSFFSTLAWGISGILMTTIVCASALALYGMNIVDRKTSTLTGFAQETIKSLPQIIDALPPAVADVLEDERMPGYVDSLEVSARLVRAESYGRGGRWARPVIEVHNGGAKMVSLLSMHVVVLDENGDPMGETNEWAATPFAADHDWRGPLMPGATRHIVARHVRMPDGDSLDEMRAEAEITDVRVWRGDSAETGLAANANAEDSTFAPVSRGLQSARTLRVGGSAQAEASGSS